MAASLRERLQAQREAQLQDKRLTLRLPGWEGPRLFVRYRAVEWEKTVELLDPAADAKAALRTNLETLVAACDAILVQEDGDEKAKSLADELRSQGEDVHGEVRFDEYAIDVLALQVEGEDGLLRSPKSAVETALACFAGAVSPELAVAEHAAKIGSWMAGETASVDESLLGG